MRAISIRLDERLGRQFDQLCQIGGYKKNTVLTRLIAAYVNYYGAGRKTSPATRRSKSLDPFMKVIGLMKQPALLPSGDEIDQIVYGL